MARGTGVGGSLKPLHYSWFEAQTETVAEAKEMMFRVNADRDEASILGQLGFK